MADLTFTITVPESEKARVLSALKKRFNVDTGPEVLGAIRRVIKRWVIAQEMDDALQAARNVADPEVL